jgi:hypothetical protein
MKLVHACQLTGDATLYKIAEKLNPVNKKRLITSKGDVDEDRATGMHGDASNH